MPARAYRDRVDAGRQLGAAVAARTGLAGDVARECARKALHDVLHDAPEDAPEEVPPHVLVLGLPRGGVVVAAEVAAALCAPLDVVVVRKLGFPGQHELAMGAVASGGMLVLNDELVARSGLRGRELEARVVSCRRELAELEARLRNGRAGAPLRGATVVVVDDGMATGATMRVATAACRAAGAARVIAAAPVASREAVESLGVHSDARPDVIVVPLVPDDLRAVGAFYDEFSSVDEGTVRRLLAWSDG